MTVKYAIYAVGQRKSALPFKAHIFFSQLIFDSFIAVSLYFLANECINLNSSNFNHNIIADELLLNFGAKF